MFLQIAVSGTPPPSPPPPMVLTDGFEASNCGTTQTQGVHLLLRPRGQYISCDDTCALAGAQCVTPDAAIYSESCVGSTMNHFGETCNSYSAYQTTSGAPAFNPSSNTCSYLSSAPSISDFCGYRMSSSATQRICPCYHDSPPPPSPPPPLPPFPPDAAPAPPPAVPPTIPPPSPPDLASGYDANNCRTTLAQSVHLLAQPAGQYISCDDTCALAGAQCVVPDAAIYGQSCVSQTASHLGFTCAPIDTMSPP